MPTRRRTPQANSRRIESIARGLRTHPPHRRLHILYLRRALRLAAQSVIDTHHRVSIRRVILHEIRRAPAISKPPPARMKPNHYRKRSFAIRQIDIAKTSPVVLDISHALHGREQRWEPASTSAPLTYFGYSG